jgi:hypothetical protein
MNETESSETKPKRMVRRSVAIAFGIICIILAVGLVGAFAYYIPTISDIERKVDNLTNAINPYNLTLTYIRIVLPEGSGQVPYYFGKNEYIFSGPIPASQNTSQLVFSVYLGGQSFASVYDYNAYPGATYEVLGIEIKVSEVHSDYIVLLVKSL